MITSIDKALVGLIIAAVANYTDFGADTTLMEVVQALVAGVIGGVAVWAAPNK